MDSATGWILGIIGTLIGGVVLLYIEYGYFQKRKYGNGSQKAESGGNSINRAVHDLRVNHPDAFDVTTKLPLEMRDELLRRSSLVITLLSEGRAVNPLLLKALIALLEGKPKVDTSTVKWFKETKEDLELSALLLMLEIYGTAAIAALEDTYLNDKEDLLVLAKEQLQK